jgi:hypothetical protein|uniref:Uncharacterized protein n=1 Tax=Populus trichocarpa TaxID=3694 RepID=A0A2K2ADE6_POPTR
MSVTSEGMFLLSVKRNLISLSGCGCHIYSRGTVAMSRFLFKIGNKEIDSEKKKKRRREKNLVLAVMLFSKTLY